MSRWLALIVAMLLPVGEAHAQAAQADTETVVLEDSELEAVTRDVASQLRCPVCQGLSVQDSPTEFAQDMKALIRDQLAEGRTPEEVKAYFVGRYGEWVLLEPKPEGFNLAVYLLPVFGLILGVGIVARSVRRWVRQGGAAEGAGDADDDPIDGGR